MTSSRFSFPESTLPDVQSRKGYGLTGHETGIHERWADSKGVLDVSVARVDTDVIIVSVVSSDLKIEDDIKEAMMRVDT